MDPVARRFPPRGLGARRRQLRRELVLPDPARRAARPDDHRRPPAGLVLCPGRDGGLGARRLPRLRHRLLRLRHHRRAAAALLRRDRAVSTRCSTSTTEWGAWLILIKGATPIPYKLVTIASGAFHFDLLTFTICLADLARHPLLPDRGAALAVRRADPRLHREAADARVQRLGGGAGRRLPGGGDGAMNALQLRALGPTLGSLLLLLGALGFQYVGGLAPCHLCILQRWPHGIAVALGLLILVWPRRWLALVAGLVVLDGAGIGVYHVGVERGWWQGPTTCTAPAPGEHGAGRAARPDPGDAGGALRPGGLEPRSGSRWPGGTRSCRSGSSGSGGGPTPRARRPSRGSPSSFRAGGWAGTCARRSAAARGSAGPACGAGSCRPA